MITRKRTLKLLFTFRKVLISDNLSFFFFAQAIRKTWLLVPNVLLFLSFIWLLQVQLRANDEVASLTHR